MSKTTSQPMEARLEAFRHVTIGVADLDVALALWVDQFGFEIAASAEGPDADLGRLWSLDPGDIRRQALVRSPGQSRGMLHFVEFVDPEPPVRAGAQNYDLVPKNLDVHVVDLPTRFEELTAAGYAFSTTTVTEADQSIGGRFREGHLAGHDDINIVLVEELGVKPWETQVYTPEGYFGVGPLIPVVGEIEAEKSFFVDVIGYEFQSEAVLRGPEIERMIGLPPGTGVATVVLGGEEAFGSLMLVDYQGVESENLYPRARPKALGILHITFVTENSGPVRSRLTRAGVGILEYGQVNALFGSGEMIAFSSPAGMRIEVLQSARL